MNPKETGAYVSAPDYRDRLAAAVAAAPVVSPADIPSWWHTDLGSVLDQNKTPSCVAHNIAYLMRRHWFRETGKVIDFSPRFLDILAKRYDGQDRATGGTYPRLVLKLAVQYGCATTATLPNDTTLDTLSYRDDSLLTDFVMGEAAAFKIPGFIGVPLDQASTRRAIYLYDAVTALFAIGSEFWLPSWAAKDIDPVRTPQTKVSGHQLALVGWSSATTNIGRNEWGVEWDSQGEFHYDTDAWSGYIFEQWAIAEIPDDVKAFLKTLPKQENFHYLWLRNLKRGDFNEDVKMAQVAYMILGLLKPLLPEEFGHFGPKMVAANYAFQTSRGIVNPSGDNIGPATRMHLSKLFAL